MSRNWSFTFPQGIGVVNLCLGLGHAAAPWLLGYADIPRAAVSSVATGLVLAVFGAARALGAGMWANIVCLVVGVWMLFAPGVLQYGSMANLRHGYDAFAALEALWIGLAVIAMAGCSALATWLGRPTAPAVPAA